MNIIFQSARLYFREFTENDLQLLVDLNTNPNVLKYLHEPSTSVEDIDWILHNNILAQYKLFGFGRWAAHLKTNHTFIGWCGLKYLKDNDEIDLGYRYKEAFWRNGYGFEAAQATIDYGFTILKLEKLCARALPGNIASWKIMEKCGMKYLGEVIDDDDLFVKKYAITNPAATL